MNKQTMGPVSVGGNGLFAGALCVCIAEVNGPNHVDRILEREANKKLLAAAYTAFDRAGRELGIDAATLARSVDLVALIRALDFYAKRKNWKEVETGIGCYPGEAVDYGAKARTVLAALNKPL